MLAEIDKLRGKKQPDRLARKALVAEQQHLRELWGNVRRQAKLQEEVLTKEKGKGIAEPPAAGALQLRASHRFQNFRLSGCAQGLDPLVLGVCLVRPG